MCVWFSLNINSCCLLENSSVTEDVLGQFSAVSLMLGTSMKEVLYGLQRLCKIRLDLNPDNRTDTKFLVMKSLALFFHDLDDNFTSCPL